jgi:hypothetical protein
MLEYTDTIGSTHGKSLLSSDDLLIMRWRVRSQRGEQKDILNFTRNPLCLYFQFDFRPHKQRRRIEETMSSSLHTSIASRPEIKNGSVAVLSRALGL